MTSLQDPRWLAMRPAWREHLLEKHRDINVWDEWWEPTEAAFKERCSKIGISVDKIYFSGFGSQGDGACFEGSIADWDLFLTHVGETDQRLYAIAAGRHNFNGWTMVLRQYDQHYYHPMTVSAGVEFYTINSIDPEVDPLRHQAYALLLDALESDGNRRLDELEATYLEACRDLMKDLYRELEEEHDRLTSDEEVACYILEFDPSELVDPDEEQEATDSCAF